MNWLPDVASLRMAQPCRTLRSNRPKAAGIARATTDLLVNGQVLCQLRYRGKEVDSTIRFERMRAFANGFAGRRLRPLGYVERDWRRTTGSNREPSALEAAALPVELARHGWYLVHGSNVRPPAS